MSKQNTGRTFGLFLLGATVAVAGTAAYLYFSDEARGRVEGMINREKAKFYVRHKLNGSDALVNAVDNLSDAEITTLVNLADTANNAADSAQDTLSSLVNTAKDKTNQATEKVADLFNN
ncbi:hypothetical protein HZY86_06995 [Aerococcaceae bacterium DSM 111020]|nr:hypothetical protein [Aerococcaceae bacterium DSM 111020]